MKKIAFILIVLALLTGSALADHGIDQTPETQGVVIATTLDAVGNFASTTDLQWRITDAAAGLNGIPPLNAGECHYASTYTEDSYSNGIGLIAYDKNMDVETSEQLSGAWNIDADKQLAYVGVDGARVYSDEYIMVDGVANFTTTESQMLCVFAETATSTFPAYCNFAESGSTVDMTVANVRTNSMDRFIVPSADTSVELEHDIQVTELIEDLPSMGSASAFMNVNIQEARGMRTYSYWNGEGYFDLYSDSALAEQIEFSEATSVNGDITVFDKQMNYNSLFTGQGAQDSVVIVNRV